MRTADEANIDAGEWAALDAQIRTWWDRGMHTANEDDVAADPTGTLLELPFPYITPCGAAAEEFPEMYAWDTYFINRGLLAHGRHEVVRGHIENQLYLIETYGMVLNGNRSYYLTRSQPPLSAASVQDYLSEVPDPELATRAIAALSREYRDYWCADHHSTPIHLATNRDLGDPSLRIELASEAETGQDFNALYGGDIREYVPLMTNSILVEYANVLAWLHEKWGDPREASVWRQESARRAKLINQYCWDTATGLYREYNWKTGTQSERLGLTSVWPLWAGIATPSQAAQTVTHLRKWLHPCGLPTTPEEYPSPHPEWDTLQWNYPSVWPPEQLMVVETLAKYGLTEFAREIASQFLTAELRRYELTGEFWERYDASSVQVAPPVERYETAPMHGWSTATFAVLGRFLFDGQNAAA